MKILVVASGDYFSSYGGGQIYVKNIVNELSKTNNEIIVMSISNNKNLNSLKVKKIEEKNLTIIQVSVNIEHKDNNLPLELQPDLLLIVRKILYELSPDIIHANGWKVLFSYIAKQMNIPCIVTAHHGGIVCPNGMLMDIDEKVCYKEVNLKNCLNCSLNYVPGGKIFNKITEYIPYPIVYKIGNSLSKIRNIPYVSPSFVTAYGLKHKITSNDILKKNVSSIIAPSSAMMKVLLKNGFKKEKIRFIPHGIKPLPNKLNVVSDKVKLGYVGRITYVKGLHILIEVLNELKLNNYELHIYGEAVTKEEKKYYLKLKSKSKNLPIYWHGKKEQNQIDEAYHSFNLLVFPSICLEVFGLTILESFSTGRPVIASKSGGPEDLIIEGKNGYLFEPNNVKSLKSILEKILKDKNLLISLINHTKLEKKFFLETHINNLLNLYNELLDKEKNEKNSSF